MEFRVGDKVKIISKKNGDQYTTYGFEIGGKYDVKAIGSNRLTIFNKKQELTGYIYKYNVELVEKQFTKSDLKDGDKCTLKNGRVVFVDKTSDYCFENIDEQLKYFNDDVSIVKVERPVKYETLFERKEEILDEAEKKYLASVIRPFRDRTIYISKIKKYSEEQIIMCIDGYYDFFKMPVFEANTMYKGMKLDEKYTLKELGL